LKLVRCVLCFVCLIFFCLFNFIHSAVAQGATLAPSKRVVNNLGETPWQFIEDQDPTNAQAPGLNDTGWQQVGVPYSADQLDTFINTQSDGGAEFLNSTVNWHRKHFTMDPQYAKSKVGLRRPCASRFQNAPDRVKPSCQEPQSSFRRSSA
jgi:beta-galactosidase